MSSTILYGQDAVRYILRTHNNKATLDEIKKEIDQLIKEGKVSDSMHHTVGRALNCMRRSYEVKVKTDKVGRVLYYELVNLEMAAQ